MTSRALRRRLHHGDVDGKRHEHLETSGLDDMLRDISDNERKREHHHWTLIVFPVNCTVGTMVRFGSGTLIGRLLPFPSATQNGQTKKLLVPSLSPLQALLQSEKQRADDSERKCAEALESNEEMRKKLEETQRRVHQLQEPLNRMPGTYLDQKEKLIKYSDFVNKELILFSMTYHSVNSELRELPATVVGSGIADQIRLAELILNDVDSVVYLVDAYDKERFAEGIRSISTTTKDFSWKDSGHCGEICCGHLLSDYLLFGNDKEKKSHAILRYLACAFPGVADH
ncbi:unnamed protein product [Camellia sinensis]